jgi:hypothetical protein
LAVETPSGPASRTGSASNASTGPAIAVLPPVPGTGDNLATKLNPTARDEHPDPV